MKKLDEKFISELNYRSEEERKHHISENDLKDAYILGRNSSWNNKKEIKQDEALNTLKAALSDLCDTKPTSRSKIAFLRQLENFKPKKTKVLASNLGCNYKDSKFRQLKYATSKFIRKYGLKISLIKEGKDNYYQLKLAC